MKGRLPKYGRTRDELLILPAATFVLGDTDAEAADLAREVRRRAGLAADRAAGSSSSCGTPTCPASTSDGPLPDFDPVVSDNLIAKGRASVRQFAKDPVALAGEWRARAAAGKLSAREVVIEVTGRQSFIGSPETVAAAINELRAGRRRRRLHPGPAHHPRRPGCRSSTQVVPLLQERGVFRADYAGTTLRDHLGLAPLVRPAEKAQRPVARVAIMRFITITLIVHAPDPFTGAQKSHRASGSAEVHRQRPARRGARLRRVRGRGAARAAVHLLVADRGAQPHRRPDHADPAVHRGDHAVAAGPGARVRGLCHPGPPLRRAARADHRKGNGAAQRELFNVTPEDQWDRNAESLRGVPADVAAATRSPTSTKFRPPLHEAEVWPRPLQQPGPHLARQRHQQGIGRPGGPLR